MAQKRNSEDSVFIEEIVKGGDSITFQLSYIVSLVGTGDLNKALCFSFCFHLQVLRWSSFSGQGTVALCQVNQTTARENTAKCCDNTSTSIREASAPLMETRANCYRKVRD